MRGGKTSPRDGAEATPEQTTSFTASPGAPVRTAGPVRDREKPKEIIIGFSNQDVFVMCSRHAYEVWQWTVKKGFYPFQQAPKDYLKLLAGVASGTGNGP